MEERILKDGQVRPGDILKVDSFLNHQLDVAFLAETGKAFYEHFEGHGINKILTVEASGIALSCMAAQYFRVPVLFAKKAKSRNLDNDLYTAVARSYTYGIDNTLTVSKRFLTSCAPRPARPLPESRSRLRKAIRAAVMHCGPKTMMFSVWRSLMR